MNELLNDTLETIKNYYDDLVGVLPKVGLAIIVFILMLSIAAWIRSFSRQTMSKRMQDPLLSNFLARVIYLALVVLGIVIVLQIIGLGGAAASLLAGAGIGAFVIGFAFKDIGENFLAGIMMAFKRPFNIGDVIETGDVTGKVVGLSLRDTQIKTFAGKDVFIPNGTIMNNPIINRTIDGYLRYDFTVGLDYEDNLKEGVAIIKKTVQETPGVLDIPGKQVNVLLEELAVSTVNVTAYLWIDMDDPKTVGVHVLSEAMERTVVALAKAGYYLPADIVEIKNYQENIIATEARERAVAEA